MVMREVLMQLFGEAVTDDNFAKFNAELGKRFVANVNASDKMKENAEEKM